MALPVNYTEELKSIRSDLQAKIDKLESNTSYINDTLTQKSTIMQEELVKHKVNMPAIYYDISFYKFLLSRQNWMNYSIAVPISHHM